MRDALTAVLVMLLVVGFAFPVHAETADVVVVGGGGAGLVAALEAANHGAEVILLEKLAFLGGETLISGGAFQAAGTSYQEEQGIEDSAEELFKYWMRSSLFRSNPDLVRMVAVESAANVDWLAEHGMPISPDVGQGAWSPDVPLRVHRADGGGSGFISSLESAVEEAGVTIYKNTKAVALIEDDGRIVGVTAEGQVSEVRANAVILATGGFGYNTDLIAEYAPKFGEAIPVSTPGNTGTGLLMAKDVGAQTEGVFSCIGFRTVEGYGWASPIAGLGMSPILYVNSEGKRFVDEGGHYALMAEAIYLQGGLIHQVFDEEYLSGLPENTQNDVAEAVENGVITKADSLAALADGLGIPNDALTATVEEFNANSADGHDPLFFRDPDTLVVLDSAPYYALPVSLAHLGTIGGLKINTAAEVISENGQPIPGLFAAGSVTGGFLGEVYPAGGSAIAMIIATGRAAGHSAATQ